MMTKSELEVRLKLVAGRARDGQMARRRKQDPKNGDGGYKWAGHSIDWLDFKFHQRPHRSLT
jgi:hypothetical protein